MRTTSLIINSLQTTGCLAASTVTFVIPAGALLQALSLKSKGVDPLRSPLVAEIVQRPAYWLSIIFLVLSISVLIPAVLEAVRRDGHVYRRDIAEACRGAVGVGLGLLAIVGAVGSYTLSLPALAVLMAPAATVISSQVMFRVLFPRDVNPFRFQ